MARNWVDCVTEKKRIESISKERTSRQKFNETNHDNEEEDDLESKAKQSWVEQRRKKKWKEIQFISPSIYDLIPVY
jgi:hypothetical protein